MIHRSCTASETGADSLLFASKKGVYTKIGDTLKSFDAICNGQADDLPEQAFLYVGDLEEVRAKSKAM